MNCGSHSPRVALAFLPAFPTPGLDLRRPFWQLDKALTTSSPRRQANEPLPRDASRFHSASCYS
jgi:hypothetical protein